MGIYINVLHFKTEINIDTEYARLVRSHCFKLNGDGVLDHKPKASGLARPSAIVYPC